MTNEKTLGADAAAVDTARFAFDEPKLTHAATSFDCTVVAGDSDPDGDVGVPKAYVVGLRLHAGWPDVPVSIRTMSKRLRVTFEVIE